MVDGFQYGNSPFSYMNGEIDGKTLVITTTNGTQAIEAAKDSQVILVGAFVNFEAITEVPEYYPTRTEAAIFAQQGADIAAAAEAGIMLGGDGLHGVHGVA